MRNRHLFFAFLFATALAATAHAREDCAGADLILRNGNIVTMNDRDSVAQAMAVRSGRLVAVGPTEEVRRCASAATRVVDLAGKTVLPGLIDVHTHALGWALRVVTGELELGPSQVSSIGDVQKKIAERVRQKPDAWLRGYGWDDKRFAEQRYINRQDIDAVSGQAPVYLHHVSGHLAAVNTAALKLAGITRETPDPDGGVIERDGHGEPTGILKENAMRLASRLLPPQDPQSAVDAVRLVSEQALAAGLTTIHDIWVSPEHMRAYQEAARRGWLKVRVQLVPGVSSVEAAERLAATGLHTGFGDNRLKLGGVKLFADGGMGARTIAIYPPGVEGEPDNVGLLLWDPDELQRAHHVLAAAGWQLITHAIGDRAMDQVLDSYAAVMKELRLKAPRFRIAHGGISTPAIQRRLRELNVMVDGNPPFVYWIGSWFLKYGPERVRWSYPGRSYFENGIVLGGASDVYVTPISPWWGIWAGVVRREATTGRVLAPEERLTPQQILQVYTRNGAYIGREEEDKGSLEPGKLADFIVVDRDVFAVPHDELKDVQVLATYVGGEEVFRRQGPSPAKE